MTDDTRKLGRNVTVGSKTYGPNDDVPPEVAEQILNPKAWQPLNPDEGGADTGPAENPDAGTTSGARLATNVTVGAANYGPNDHVPDDIARQISNPKAWEGGKLPDLGDTPKQSTPTQDQQSPPEQQPDDNPPAEPEPETAPARKGRRS